MDEPGFHARRRAEKEAEIGKPTRSRTLKPVENEVNDEELGNSGEATATANYGSQAHSYRPPHPIEPIRISSNSGLSTGSTAMLSPLSAVERSKALPRPARMSPHLEFMCGPLLRYDTVEDNVWHGAAMIVTADARSDYSPEPILTLSWDPHVSVVAGATKPGRPFADGSRARTSSGNSRHQRLPSITIPPFDPHSLHEPTPPLHDLDGIDYPLPSYSETNANANGNGHVRKPSMTSKQAKINGKEIWVYHGNSGTFTFWRFMIEIPLSNLEMPVYYSINNGAFIEFVVPAIGQNMRWAAHSCNGFSAGINPDDFRGPGFQSGYDPLWTDLLNAHKEKPYHCMVGGGDQIYCDAIMRELELQDWIHCKTHEEKIGFPMTDELLLAIDRFYFSHYCMNFRRGMFARCNRSIPMVNMLDDHDLIDGFGSYPADLQSSPVFSTIGSRGYFFFLLFQQFTVDDVDGTKRDSRHPNKALVLGRDGPWIPFPSHSLVTYLGPKVYMLLLDCRAERRKEEVCSWQTYDAVWRKLASLPRTVEHIIVQLGIPIAYPRMNFMEAALDSKYNPLTMLGKSGSLGLSGFVNKFNKEAELLDDLNDHWTAKHHKNERNWLIIQLQRLAEKQNVRISFLSGDVHCAAVGCLKTLTKGKNNPIEPAKDMRYMLNIVTSAIVNTPPPNAVLTMVSYLGKRTHKTLHKEQTDECMINLFEKDTDGTNNKLSNIMGRRNYTSVDYNPTTGDLVFDIRVEQTKGHGETVGYAVTAPPPRWLTS